AVQDFIEPGNAGGDPFRRILLKARSVSSDLLGRFGRLRLRVTMRTVCFAVHCVASCSVSPPSSTDTPTWIGRRLERPGATRWTTVTPRKFEAKRYHRGWQVPPW